MADPITYVPSIVGTVSVKDLAAAIAWYGEKLEMTPTYTVEEIGWAELATALPGFTLGLFAGEAHPGASDNVTITLGVQDIDASRTTLESRGVEFVGPTDEMPGMVKLASFRDLDGNLFMLAQTLMEQP